MPTLTIDFLLGRIAAQMHLSKETEHEVLQEIRTHLEDAAAAARAQGLDDQAALRQAAERFGLEEVGAELEAVHADREAVDAVLAVALPVLFAVILRWLTFTPDGTALAWRQFLVRPAFWVVAAGSLLVPLIWFRRWRYALVGWGIFWVLTVIFAVFPSRNQW